MKPKIGYLIDDNYGNWGNDEPDWKFYTEDNVPRYKLEHPVPNKVKRIVYWEVAEDE